MRWLPNARLISETAPDRTNSHWAKAASAEKPPAKIDVGAKTACPPRARCASPP